MPGTEKRVVTLVDSSYQPSKAELEEPIRIPEGMTPDDLARAIMRPVQFKKKFRGRNKISEHKRLQDWDGFQQGFGGLSG